ncbi:DUF6880 family protein [Martelella mediterranea]|uniref:Uncharacterized protein n=1 Tax=Martelella mediterranea DSM 17316 TaxID=1122214 RepID=A0A1U9Z0B3_9HYPH|nr:DUF6880 family protein [Martelella mediterranea]AQZ51129.1 hypothetical protein Mame_01785 [Martelella mediterranea DSM 17316]
MAKKTTLNAKNLEALGAKRLAELLIEISTGSAAHKRRLRLELAGEQSSGEVAREIRKHLTRIQRARSFIDWRKVKKLKSDLETQRSAIVEKLEPADPDEALELIWRFLHLADSIFARSDDGSGSLVESFHAACVDAGRIAKASKTSPEALAEKVFQALQDNGYGQYDPLIEEMIPALETDGLVRLKDLSTQWLDEARKEKPRRDGRIIGMSQNGPIYEDEVYSRHDDLSARIALEAIADAEGDVDAYIALQTEQALKSPMIAARMAERLLKVNRAGEALKRLDQAAPEKDRSFPVLEWEQTRADALEALDRANEAQRFRWACFEASLEQQHLRDYLKRLPDFDDMEAEEKALAWVVDYPSVHQALLFFMEWPALREANALILARYTEIDGNYYELLTPVSETLKEKYPLAATLLLRAMIDFSLKNARSSRYKHAAGHLMTCETLALQIDDFGPCEPHHAYLEKLQRDHGRKPGFWTAVERLY